MVKKLKTGVKGLDHILKGGIRKYSSVLVTGPPGIGKTILCLHFLIEGAKNGEPGLYISSEDSVQNIKEYARTLGLPLDKYEEKNMITFIKQPTFPKKLMSIITPLTVMRKKKIERLVMDSLTMFEYSHISGEMDYRKEVLDFIERMKKFKVTSLAVTEKNITNIDTMQYNSEDFLFDGLIIMFRIRQDNYFEQCLTVPKLRGQDHMLNIYPFIIKKGGIKVYPDEVPFSLVSEVEEE